LSALDASKKIILDYKEVYCMDTEITAPDIYLPKNSYISDDCHLNGNVHFIE